MNSAAHNVTNVQTPRFSPQVTKQSEIATGGVQTNLERLPAIPQGAESNLLNTDLIEKDCVLQLQSKFEDRASSI